MWVEVTLCKDKLYLACCYIPQREFDFYNLYELVHDDFIFYVCVNILDK